MENKIIKQNEEVKGIKGVVTVKAFKAGTIDKVMPYVTQLKIYLQLARENPKLRDFLIRQSEDVRAKIKEIFDAAQIGEPIIQNNIVVSSPNVGKDVIIQRLASINTYSLNILWGEIGTGNTTPGVGDVALTAPTNRAPISFSEDFGATTAIVQFYIPDAALANSTYYEIGTFIDGSSTIGSGQMFNHALLTVPYVKVAGTDTTIEVDYIVT